MCTLDDIRKLTHAFKLRGTDIHHRHRYYSVPGRLPVECILDVADFGKFPPSVIDIFRSEVRVLNQPGLCTHE